MENIRENVSFMLIRRENADIFVSYHNLILSSSAYRPIEPYSNQQIEPKYKYICPLVKLFEPRLL